MYPFKRIRSLAFLQIVVFSQAAMATDTNMSQFFTQGEVGVDFRLRFEQAEDETHSTAEAFTLRTLLSLKSGDVDGIGGFLEIEDTSAIGGANYTDGVQNRGTVLIADPVGTEVNQAYVQYATPWGLTTTLGRQAIALGEERFVGTVGFRQNNQSYEALSLRYQGQSRHIFYYGYVDNVQRVFGDEADDVPALRLGDHDHDSHLVNMTFALGDWGTSESYGYLIDNKDLPRVSTNTIGTRLSGNHRLGRFTYLYDLEFARQSSSNNNPFNYDANYRHLNLGISYKRISLQLSQERLESGDGFGFVTPLATLHKFQGWADKFVAMTPSEGLIDNFLTLGGRWPGFRYRIRYHQFKTDAGSTDIGEEFNVQVQRKLGQAYRLELKYADYRAAGDTAAGVTAPGDLDSDTRRVFLTFTASF